MSKRWKVGMSLLLALSMGTGNAVMAAPEVRAEEAEDVTKENFGREQQKAEYAEGEAIILYETDKAASAKAAATGIGGDIQIVQTYDFSTDHPTAKAESTQGGAGISVSLVKSDTYATEELIEKLGQRKDIKYAEPNYRIKAMGTGEDTYRKYQWALENLGQNGGNEGLDVNAESLGGDVDEEERVIALVDTGIDYTHEDLADVVWQNPVQSNKLKGAHGYDFINYDEDPLDDNGHGSHCSGIMAATSGNGVGIAGVAKSDNIKIMALKILDAQGYGYGMEAIGAYNYIYKAQQLGVNVVAVNNSWGGAGEDSYILGELINLVGANGAISVCAAGNAAEDNDVVEAIPANIDSPYVIAVAASNGKDELAAFSNYGATSVDIAAPGTDILSTVSYNCFNPGIYENVDEICSHMEDFTEGTLVEKISEDGYTDAVVTDGDISYGYAAKTGDAQMSVELSENSYFGVKKAGEKSLQWNIKGAKKGDLYHLYLPYTVAADDKNSHLSVMAKVSGPSGAEFVDPNDWFATLSTLYVCEGVLDENGAYEETDDDFLSGAYIDEGNYWTHFSAELSGNVKQGQTRALVMQVEACADGDYTVNLDNFGVSKSGVAEEQYGKYDYYNGTSMATPYVTGAVASVANCYPEETALDVKARILGSTRKSDSLQGKVATGGVLDLSKAQSPNMSIDSTMLDMDNLIQIYGYYLDEAVVTVNGEEVEVLDRDNTYITIDGTDYVNKKITIGLEKEADSLSIPCFFMRGESFTYGTSIEAAITDGNVVSAGNSLYFVNDAGTVSKGTPAESEGAKTLQWEEGCFGYLADIFGDDYLYCTEYTLHNLTDVVYADSTLWTVLKIDAGYSEDTALVWYNDVFGWEKVSSLPEKMESVEGYSLASYNGEVYLFGGYDTAPHEFSTDFYKYNVEEMTWEEMPELPEGRVYAQAVQTGDKLVVTLGGSAEETTAKNLIYDGENWSVSETELGSAVDTESYIFEKGTEYEKVVSVAKAQIGTVSNGLIYTDCRVEGLGDTFIYDVAEDCYEASGYLLDSATLYCNHLYATTVQNDLYVLFGFEEEDFYEDWKNSARKAAYDEDYYEEDGWDEEGSEDDFYWGSYIELLTMPVETGYAEVVDKSEDGAYAYGAGYYAPGEKACLTAEAYENYFVKGMTVNGQKIEAEGDFYSYVSDRFASNEKLEVAVQAGAYVTEVTLPETQKLEAGKSVQLEAKVLPENAENKKLIWTSENSAVVAVDENGKLTAAKDAVAGTEVVISVSSADRELPMAECKVVIEKAAVTETPSTNAPSTNTPATPDNGNTTPEEKKLPKAGSKVTVGKDTYKVLTSTDNSKTVQLVTFGNKKATKASVMATVKIEGVTYKVTGVAANAFKNCRKLKNVTIGKNVTSIGKNAFKGCKKLAKVTIKSTKLKKANFSNTSKKLVVKVPKKVKTKYKKLFKKSGFKGTVK